VTQGAGSDRRARIGPGTNRVRAHGLPAGLAEVLVAFDVATAQGTLAVVSDAVERLTGQAPSSVAAFLRGHRAALVE
jgi:NAD(P)H dehydrogenase (quinone)